MSSSLYVEVEWVDIISTSGWEKSDEINAVTQRKLLREYL
jgi:hypothetical protein